MQVKNNFLAAGGTILELTAAQGAEIYRDGCALLLPAEDGKEPNCLTGRLLIDCMGNASPIVRQVCDYFGSRCFVSLRPQYYWQPYVDSQDYSLKATQEVAEVEGGLSWLTCTANGKINLGAVKKMKAFNNIVVLHCSPVFSSTAPLELDV